MLRMSTHFTTEILKADSPVSGFRATFSKRKYLQPWFVSNPIVPPSYITCEIGTLLQTSSQVKRWAFSSQIW
jgi:hypothetical protein